MGVRSEGASLKYEYNAREGIYSKGSRGEELVYKGSENMPEFAKDNPRFFWQCAEKFERADGNQYRKIEFSLPHELNIEENVALAKTYAEKLLGNEYVYSIAVHNKLSREGEVQNIHCHIMFSERKLDGVERSYDQFFKQPNHGGLRKDRDWWKRSTLYNVRELWEETLNEKLKERQEIREYFRSFKTPEMKSKIIAKTDQIIKKYEAAYEKASEEYDLLNSSSLQLKEAIDSLSEVDRKYLVQENNQRIDLLKAEKVKVDSLVEKQKAIKDPEVIKREIYDSLTSGAYSKTLEAINHNEFSIKRSKPGSSDEAVLLRELEQNKAFIKEIHKLDISGKFNEIHSARSSVFKELRVHQDAIKGELRLAVDKNNALFRADLKKDPLTQEGYRKGNRRKYTPKKRRVNTGTLRTGKLFNTKNVEEEEIERDIEF